MLPWFTSIAFDDHERGVIEESIILLLERLHSRQGGYVRLIDRYNGELDTNEGAQELIAHLVAQSPAMLVGAGYQNFKPQGAGAMNYSGRLEVELIMATSAVRNYQSRTKGGLEPGIYGMLRDARALVVGRNLGIGTNRIVLVREGPLWTTRGLTLWRLQLAIGTTLAQDALETLTEWAPEPAESIEVDHNLAGEEDSDAVNPIATSEATP